MKSNFTDSITDFVRQAEPDLDSRLVSQAEVLDEIKCTNPTIGKWIDSNDVQYLLAAFALSDGDFAEEFPRMAHLKEHDRKQIIKTFEDHFDHCHHCYRKRGFDLELNSRIERAFRQNKEQFVNQLREDKSDTSGEGDHQRLKGAARAAHK
jgi:hypothetical protein